MNTAAQTVVDVPGVSTWIYYFNNAYTGSEGSLYAGKDEYGAIYRSYIVWSDILSYVPQGVQISNVKFFITWGGNGASSAQIEFHDFTYTGNLVTDYSSISSGQLWGTISATTTEYSFSQLTAKVQSVVNAGNGIVYIGIKNQNESSNNYFVLENVNVSLQITYTGNVNVTQVDEDNYPFGQVGRWASNIWNYTNVPFSLSAPTGSAVGLKSDQNFRPNTNQKYWEWSQNNSNIIIPNPHNFTILSGTNVLKSTFKSTSSGVTITNNLEGTGLEGGVVKFKDPWLIDYPDPNFGNTLGNQGMNAPFIQQNVPFNPNSGTNYMGIFLNQDYIGTNPVYYSVQGIYPPQTIPLGGNIGSRKFWFSNWSQSGGASFQNSVNYLTTGVKFTGTGNVTVTANLKGQGLSDDINTYNSNSARKFVQSLDGSYFNVYRSMNKIWGEETEDVADWNLLSGSSPISTVDSKSPVTIQL